MSFQHEQDTYNLRDFLVNIKILAAVERVTHDDHEQNIVQLRTMKISDKMYEWCETTYSVLKYRNKGVRMF